MFSKQIRKNDLLEEHLDGGDKINKNLLGFIACKTFESGFSGLAFI